MKRSLISVLFSMMLLLIIFFTAGSTGAAPNNPSQVTGFGPWQIFTIDSQNNVGQFLSMARKPNTNIPYIAYYDATAGDLKIANETPGNCGPNQSWTCSIQDGSSSADVGKYLSLAFRSDGNYGVAYYDAVNGVNRYTNPADGLQGEIVEFYQGASVGTFNALVFDGSGVPNIAFNRSVSGPVGFGFAKRTGGGNCSPSWTCQIIQNYAGFISIDYRLYKGIGISYWGFGGYLSYAHPINSGGNCGSGTWQCDNIDIVSARGTSLQVARCSLINCLSATQIAYYDYVGQKLKLAEYLGNGQGNCPINTNWRCTIIDNVGQTTNSDGLGLSLLIDSNFKPVIVYQDLDDQSNSIVKIARPDPNGNCGLNNSWRCEVVDDGFRGGGFIDIGSALDAEIIDGRIHIAYYDASFGDLLMAVQDQPLNLTNVVYLPAIIH